MQRWCSSLPTTSVISRSCTRRLRSPSGGCSMPVNSSSNNNKCVSNEVRNGIDGQGFRVHHGYGGEENHVLRDRHRSLRLHGRRRLRVEHQAAVVTDDDGRVRIALGGEGV